MESVNRYGPIGPDEHPAADLAAMPERQANESPRPISIGIDVGQRVDYTAICLMEAWQRPSGEKRWIPGHTNARGQWLTGYYEAERETVYTARLLRRLALGTPYPTIARELAEIVCAEKLHGRPRSVYLDVTGVGAPVYDLIQEVILHHHLAGHDVSLFPITFSHGETYDARVGRLGKAYLVSRLQALLQQQRIQLPPQHPDARVMADELKAYEIRVSDDGKDTSGAFRVGSHDDYVTAVGLATLHEPDFGPGYIALDASGW